MDGLELIAFQIISAVGGARSCFIEAIQMAKINDFEKAEELLSEGDELFKQGHHAHAKLIQEEASGKSEGVNLLLIHAEDQLMSAEAFRIIAGEFIDVYKKIEE